MQALACEHRRGAQQTPSFENTCRNTAEQSLVNFKSLEYGQQRHAVYVDISHRLLGITYNTVHSYALFPGFNYKAVNVRFAVTPRQP